MTGYNIVNLSDIVNHLGEVDTKKILDGFSCPLNADVEYFLKHKAIEFSRQSLSKTHLVYTSYKGEPVLIGYFTLCSKVITIKKNILSRTMQKRIRKFSQNNSDKTELLVTANLIAQIGKNFSDEYDSLITGDELLQIALNVLASVQGMVGGKIVYLECEDNEKLISYYSKNGFCNFGRRNLDIDEKSRFKSNYLVQMLKYID